MFGGNFLTLPMHSGRAFVVDLHAVHAEIALARLRIARGDARQRDETSCIFRPALQHGKVEQGKIISLDHLFARTSRYGTREKLSRFGQQRQHFQLVEKSLRRLHIHEHADAGRNLIERIHAHRELHARVGSELIDEKLSAWVTFQILKEKRRAPCGSAGITALGDAIGDFRNFKDGISFGRNAFQLAGAVECGDPLAEVVEGQGFLSA